MGLRFAKAILVVSTTEKSGSQGDYAEIKKDTDIRIVEQSMCLEE